MNSPTPEAMKAAREHLGDYVARYLEGLSYQNVSALAIVALAIDKAVEEERAKLNTLLLGGTLSKHGRIVSVELSGGNLATDLFNVLAAIRSRKQEDDR